MNDIQTGLNNLLPPKKKSTPSGWISFNAPCCQNRGEGRDQRQRGGVLFNTNGSFQYHCFNCNFKAGWTPGHLLTKNTKLLLQWFGMNSADIGRLNLYALKIKDDQPINKPLVNFDLVEKPLPDLTLPISEWVILDKENEFTDNLTAIINYITLERGMKWDWYNWHYSHAAGYQDRVIIPFYENQKVVGYTARKIKDGKPKYITDAQPGYVFNIDAQEKDRAYIILVEGQFDAISVDGCAVMHNEPNDTQIQRINRLGREVIVVPDRDRAGAKMLKAAIENGWSVSLPPWEDQIKDVADAVKKYGRLYTLTTILHYKETNNIKIALLKKRLENV